MYTTPAAMNSVSLMSEWFSMCITLPYAASAPSSPSSTITDSPSVMKPIWLIDEQASVRLRSVENSASSAPRNIVIAAKIISALPNAALPCIRFAHSTISPNTPDFVRMPDKSADAGAGATGCAFGSQICSGNRPAFAPKPTSVSHTATVTSCCPMAARRDAKSSVPS